MNRAVVFDAKSLSESQHPPARREGRLRALFLTSNALGFATYDRELQRFSALREDLDAVHISLRPPHVMRALGSRVPLLGKWDFQSHRYMRMWGLVIASWFKGPLDARRFDVVHVTTENNAMALPGIKVRTGLPYSVYVDTTTALFCSEFGHHRLTGSLNRAAEAHIFQHADVVTCMSRWAATSVERDYGIPPARIMLARSAIELPSIEGDPMKLRAGNPIPRIVFVGNDWVRKGGDRLVAWHQEHFRDQAELHLIGKGIPALGDCLNVVVHGPVPRERLLREVLPSMDLFVLPTREDMTPWAIVEAQALMLPVISSRIGAIPELVVEGKTGLLCERDDHAGFVAAIGRLLNDTQERERFAVAARQHAMTEFEPSRWYNALFDRLHQIARPRNEGG